MSDLINNIFKEGPISQQLITRHLRKLKNYPNTGALEFFLGQVRADKKDNRKVVNSITYTCYEKMSKRELFRIIRDTFEIYPINELTIRHSLGDVSAGDICFFVGVAATHRKDARNAVAFVVDTIKNEVPIYGKEILGDGNYIWKENR